MNENDENLIKAYFEKLAYPKISEMRPLLILPIATVYGVHFNKRVTDVETTCGLTTGKVIDQPPCYAIVKDGVVAGYNQDFWSDADKYRLVLKQHLGMEVLEQAQRLPLTPDQYVAEERRKIESIGVTNASGDVGAVGPVGETPLAEKNLRDAVTQTVKIMLDEAKSKPQKRAWPEDATANWNADFIKAICDTTYDSMRMRMIGAKCNPAVADALNLIWSNSLPEQTVFWRELSRFVDMNLNRFIPPQESRPETVDAIVRRYEAMLSFTQERCDEVVAKYAVENAKLFNENFEYKKRLRIIERVVAGEPIELNTSKQPEQPVETMIRQDSVDLFGSNAAEEVANLGSIELGSEPSISRHLNGNITDIPGDQIDHNGESGIPYKDHNDTAYPFYQKSVIVHGR